MNSSISKDETLKYVLLLIGGIELCAIPFLFIPFSWMNEVHERLLGLGAIPRAPIVEYLARGLTALYAVHGALIFRLSFDVPRFRPLIQFLGWLHIALGLVMFAADIAAGMPLWWIAGEGPGIAAGGLVVLVLSRTPKEKAPRKPRSPE